MLNTHVSALIFAVFVMPAATAAQQTPPPDGQTYTLLGGLQRGYRDTQETLVEAAEKMPEEHYGFKPTPDIRPFGQLVAHAALMQFGTCAMLKGEPNPRKDEKEENTRTKAEAIALLKASNGYCDPLMSALTETTATELAKVGRNQVAKGLLPAELISHGMRMYGTMAVYLRLKGIVPPTTERRSQQMKKSQ
jgi:DinB superfamily